MPKYIIYGDDGKTPVMEFDSEKENPHFYEMLKRGASALETLNGFGQEIPVSSPSFLKSVCLFLPLLREVNDSESKLQDAFNNKINPVLRELKNFVINPKLSVAHGVFGPTFHASALSQTRLLADDIEQTYNRILNRCVTRRADLLSRLSVGLAILSVILAIVVVAG